MARLARIRMPVCTLALLVGCAGSALTASAAAAAPHRVKYLERRLEVAHRDLTDARAKLVARFEHRVAVKKSLLEDGRICQHGLSEARESDCRFHAGELVEGLEQELAAVREGKVKRPYIAALERRIDRLETELTAAKSAGPSGPARPRTP